MKTALILLALVAFANAEQAVQPFAGLISDQIIGAIEGMREQMPCGFPGMGIPPLAPFKLRHKEINIDTEAIKLQGTVDNFALNGLNDFEIDDMKVNALLSRVTYRFIFKNVNVDTSYNLNLVLKKAGFTVNMIGNGPAKLAIKDMHIFGTLRYSLGLLTGKLKLRSLEVRTHINEVDSDIEGILGEGDINHKLNDVLAEAIEIAINENEDNISDTIEAIALPAVNSILEDVALSDLVGGGGGDGEGGEKEACIPPAF